MSKCHVARLGLFAGCLAILFGSGWLCPSNGNELSTAQISALRQACARAVLEAFSLHDMDQVQRARESLAAVDPHDSLVRYLQGRLAERDGEWREAMGGYQQVMKSPGQVDAAQWVELAAGRLVRARQLHQEKQVAALLGAGEYPPSTTGYLLILPPEPIALGSTRQKDADRLEAVGVSIASWVIGSLAQIPGARPVDLHETFLLQASLRPAGKPTPLSAPARRPVEGHQGAPPLNTILGISYRLSQLVPQGPPPETPEAKIPARYLDATPTGQWSQELSAALGYFQAEHDLQPTGLLDPASRQALEQAYRQSLQRPSLPRPDPRDRSLSLADPAQGLGRMLGVEAVLSGTLERTDDKHVRWNMAWLAPEDGGLLSPPLAGVLVRDQHAASWAQMIRQIIMYSPVCQDPASCDELSIPPAPNEVGARLYGEAMLAIEAEAYATASRLFRQAAREGAGERAAWYGMAWQHDARGLDRLERELLVRLAHGAPVVFGPHLERVGWALAGGLVSHGPGSRAGTSWTGGTPLTYFPETGWIRITGNLEGR